MCVCVCVCVCVGGGGGGGGAHLAGNSLRAEKSHWQVQELKLAGPKSHTRAKMPHWSVIMGYKVQVLYSNQLCTLKPFQ